MKVERELCTHCFHLAEYHLTRVVSKKTRCVYGQPVYAWGKKWRLGDPLELNDVDKEKGCKCTEFKP